MFYRRSIVIAGLLLLLGFAGFNTKAQYTPWYYWTLLPETIMQEIAGEASGETAYKTIMETGGYTKNRRPDEYRTTFYESAYFYDKLKWYGIPGARLVRSPARNELTWNGIRGDLWEVSPNRQKIVSYRDNAFQLTMGSNSADVIAPLVWIGAGSEQDFEGLDLSGKIAVGHGHVGTIHSRARIAGAHGVVAISNSRNYSDPLQIPEGRISDFTNPRTGELITAGFAFQVNIREGQYLRNRLLRGEQIEVHALVESSMEPDELQNLDAIIPGEDPDATAVIFSAHIFEGLVKQGANDNKSGGAAILEVARVLNTLIEEGRIPRPKRSIRFWWGPEFAGSRPWVDDNFEDIRDAFCNINMDMVGEWLTMHNAHFNLMRTTFGNAHYVNDVVENYYRFVGEGNRDRVHNRREFNSIPHRLVAPFGADEPFHYSIETHYGASDHIVFGDFGVRIPGVMMIAWPDQWYHTSGDLVDKADPTQLRRAVVIGAAAAYTIASADDHMAAAIAGEIAGNAARRLGHQLNVAMDMVNSSSPAELELSYRKAVWLMEAHIENEQAAIRSVDQLASSPGALEGLLSDLQGSVRASGSAHLSALEAGMRAKASVAGLNAVSVILCDQEARADKMVPSLVPGIYKGGQGILTSKLGTLQDHQVAALPVLSRFDMTEAARLVNGQNSVLMIKKMLDAQSREETSLDDLINFFLRLQAAGVVDLS